MSAIRTRLKGLTQWIQEQNLTNEIDRACIAPIFRRHELSFERK